MSNHPLFDSYSGDHIDEMLRRIEERNASETHKEADSEFLRGERSAISEIRRILVTATYAPHQLERHTARANGDAFGLRAALVARSAWRSL